MNKNNNKSFQRNKSSDKILNNNIFEKNNNKININQKNNSSKAIINNNISQKKFFKKIPVQKILKAKNNQIQIEGEFNSFYFNNNINIYYKNLQNNILNKEILSNRIHNTNSNKNIIRNIYNNINNLHPYNKIPRKSPLQIQKKYILKNNNLFNNINDYNYINNINVYPKINLHSINNINNNNNISNRSISPLTKIKKIEVYPLNNDTHINKRYITKSPNMIESVLTNKMKKHNILKNNVLNNSNNTNNSINSFSNYSHLENSKRFSKSDNKKNKNNYSNNLFKDHSFNNYNKNSLLKVNHNLQNENNHFTQYNINNNIQINNIQNNIYKINHNPVNLLNNNYTNNSSEKKNLNNNLINNNVNNKSFNNNLNHNISISKQINSRSNSQNFPSNFLELQNNNNTNNNKIILDSNTLSKKIKKYFQFTHVGFDGEKNKEHNQDISFYEKNFAGNQNFIFMSVCDGHGVEGHNVSSFIKKTLPKDLSNNLYHKNLTTNNPFEKKEINSIIKKTFLKCNEKLINNKIINSNFSGSTCVSLIYTPNKIIVSNIGDSRAVLGKFISESQKWAAVDLSRDHKPTEKDEAKRIIENGGRIQPFTNEETGEFIGPQRVWIQNEDIPGLAMTRSFGDRVAASVGTICCPEIKEFDLKEEDKFMILASDGVWEFIDSNECVDIIKDYYLKNEIKSCCENLYFESKKRWNKEEEVVDDITMILVYFE